ncbi:hypothetical protein FGG08_000932 [Glutinoglossum americanum]|uniref:Uncharacterized protein n=1 Tax=Glutinoglossum americanum TaxID=1670608 RepID=A0A9P8L3C1_9PEZI|nr:hypothetical protein FGG08_000932 [Glutinoglossum americanum]
MNPEEQSKFAIHEAAREGRASVVESLLNASSPQIRYRANPQLAGLRDGDDRLPIHWAVSYNHRPVVELLVQRKNFDPDVQDGSGWTPLMIASSLKEGDDLVDLLLRREADVNCKSAVNPLRPVIYPSIDPPIQTALHFCASKNNIDVARKLLAHKASARIRDKRSQLPIHRAAAIGSVPMVKLLIENNSPLNAADISGLTPLHHAISEGHGDTALLLLKAGAETDVRDREGQLAIDLAPDSKIRKFVLQSAEREGIEL